MTFLFQGFAGAFVHSGAIGDHYLFGIHAAALGILLALTALSGIGVAWVANRPQPTPHAPSWRARESTRRHS